MITALPDSGPAVLRAPAPPPCTNGGCPRDFLESRHVYALVSPRARGLSVGVNLNPDARCDFDCAYCEVDRAAPRRAASLDLFLLAAELNEAIDLVRSGAIRGRPAFRAMPASLLELRHVAVSGDGEPTLCEAFAEALGVIVHLRARRREGFFKIVLISNASGFDRPAVREGLSLLTPRDEVWAKLDAGTQAHMDRINRTSVPLALVLDNILDLARRRPVVVQTLFPAFNGQGPDEDEIRAYAERLLDLRRQGADIPLVQLYSATRATNHPAIGHLPLRTLSDIARTVREVSGLRVEVF